MFSGGGVMPPNPVSSSGSRFAHFWSGLHSRGVRSATSCRRILTEIPPTMRLVFRLCRYGHITDALAILHWLRVPQRVDFKIAVMAFRVLHGLAPPYLDQLVRVADLPGRRTRSLRSSTSLQLDIPAYRLESIGRRSFPVAASTLWNTLPSEIQSSPSLTLFRQRLKTYLFQKSFPDVLLWWLRLRGPRNNICYSGHVKYFSDWLIDWSLEVNWQCTSSTCMGQQHNKEGRPGNQKRIVSVSEDCKL